MATQATQVILSGNASGAIQAVNAVTRELGALHAASLKTLTAWQALAGLGAVTGLTALVKQVTDAADALDQLSAKTGIAVEDLSKLQYAAGILDVDTEKLGKGLIRLNSEIGSAASGNADATKRFNDLGISIRGLDGRVRGGIDVIYDLADAISELPPGAAQTNAAIGIFGEKVGKDMVLALAGGSEKLRQLAQELQDLGGVITSDFAAAAGRFNDNMDRLKKSSEAVGTSIGNWLVPKVNTLLEKLQDWQASGVNLYTMLFGARSATSGLPAEAWQNLERVRQSISDLRKEQQGASDERIIDLAYEIDNLKDLEQYYIRQSKREAEAKGLKTDEEIFKEREKLAKQHQKAVAELDKLRAVISGQVSADILKTDEELTKTRVKNIQSVRDALQAAWQQTLADARKASADAKKLTEDAASIRKKGEDEAEDIRRGELPDADRAFLDARDLRIASDEARFNATAAKFAAMYGRVEGATKLAAKAVEDTERARQIAQRISDPEERARAIKDLADTEASAVEAKAKVKQQEAKQLEDTATTQADKIAQLDQQLAQLQQKLLGFELQVPVDQAIANIASVEAKLNAIPAVTVKTLEVQVKTTGETQALPQAQTTEPQFAYGGYTGRGSKWQPAGIVHAGEYVLPSEIVRQKGVLSFLEKLRKYGVSAIPGFATGGLVSGLTLGGIRPQNPYAPARAAVFNFPDLGGRFNVSMDQAVLEKLESGFARLALQKGGRR